MIEKAGASWSVIAFPATHHQRATGTPQRHFPNVLPRLAVNLVIILVIHSGVPEKCCLKTSASITAPNNNMWWS